MSTVKQTTTIKEPVAIGKQRSYNEVIEFFEKNWKVSLDGKSLERMKKLDKLFGNPSLKIKSVVIAGTNGKSLTGYFASKLLMREGLKVGAFISPHILTYNERLICDNEAISNKIFAELANEVINTAESAGIKANSYELLTQTALNYFVAEKVDVAVLEAAQGALSDATAICSPTVLAITRLIGKQTDESGKAPEDVLKEYVGVTKKNTHVVSADQNKANLKVMSEWVKEWGAHWAMPIRKLVALGYPFEQLHGRCAALAERIAYIFVNEFASHDAIVLSESILTKQKGQRGRPTLEAKRQLELNPKSTVEHFWKETISDLPGHFQLLDKEKPTILLDTAGNKDAFENLLLGIRLLHYQRPFKGLALVIGCQDGDVEPEAFAKQMRYFFKKTSGHIIVYPLAKTSGWQNDTWNIEKINSALKALKVKSRTAGSFKEAFETAKKLVSDRNGLIGLAGSPCVLQEYWTYKGIKKL